jgi:hypothetical protein
MATPEQKRTLLACLFALSSVDNSITTVEDNEIARVAREVKIEHGDFIAVRARFRRHLASLKDLQPGSSDASGSSGSSSGGSLSHLRSLARNRVRPERDRCTWPAPTLCGCCAAASFCAYFALLVYCDPPGPSRTVSQEDGAVAAGSLGRRAAARDRVGCDALIHGRGDRVAMNVAIGQPLQVAVVRDGRRIETTIVLERDARYWRTGEGLSLMTIRAAQLVTLVLGLVIGFKRPRALTARLGAWLLLTAGVFCVALPYRFAAVWRGLPLALGSVLWIPYLSTLAIPAILLTRSSPLPALRLRITGPRRRHLA